MAKRLEVVKEVRLEKLRKLRKLGIEPYPASWEEERTPIGEARNREGKEIAVAGRIWGWREHGGSIFADLRDESGQIQIWFQKDKLGKDFEILKLFDIGDFLGVKGEVVKTKAGELTIDVESFKLLTKSLRPIPSEFYGLKDIETRLRKRYFDLLVNPGSKELFVKKARFWKAIRDFLQNEGFMEVETPALEPIAGGADARPFVTHHETLNTDFYLRISLELYQKRLLVGGYEKVFEIGKVFRNEGMDQEHLQDYLQMEFYWAYSDYKDLMELTQRMYQQIVKETTGGLKTVYQGNEIDWSGKWPRVDYVEAFEEETGIDLDKDPAEEELRSFAEKNKVHLEEKIGKGRIIDSIYKKTVRPKLVQPTFLINHPVEVSPLAKKMNENKRSVERVQILVGGTEVGNGWSELNDPIDQLERFEEQQRLREEGDEEAQMLDRDFVEALEYGMPPAAGFGLSQRLFAVIVDKPIRETVFFPPFRPEK